jgi:hypothetical protein
VPAASAIDPVTLTVPSLLDTATLPTAAPLIFIEQSAAPVEFGPARNEPPT